MNIDEYDELKQHCRMLGHAIPFSYCRRLPEGRLCRLIADCWHEQFDIMSYLDTHYTPEQIQHIGAPPKPKLTSILELIERAQKAAQGNDDAASE